MKAPKPAKSPSLEGYITLKFGCNSPSVNANKTVKMILHQLWWKTGRPVNTYFSFDINTNICGLNVDVT